MSAILTPLHRPLSKREVPLQPQSVRKRQPKLELRPRRLSQRERVISKMKTETKGTQKSADTFGFGFSEPCHAGLSLCFSRCLPPCHLFGVRQPCRLLTKQMSTSTEPTEHGYCAVSTLHLPLHPDESLYRRCEYKNSLTVVKHRPTHYQATLRATRCLEAVHRTSKLGDLPLLAFFVTHTLGIAAKDLINETGRSFTDKQKLKPSPFPFSLSFTTFDKFFKICFSCRKKAYAARCESNVPRDKAMRRNEKEKKNRNVAGMGADADSVERRIKSYRWQSLRTAVVVRAG